MKGCARSCLTGVVGLVVAIAAFLFLFRQFGPDRETTVPAAVAAGFLATLSISLLWSARGVLRDRGLIRDALAGQPPVDGKWAGFSGVIRSSSPITSPISGKSAVALKYTISQRVGSGKSAHTIPHYEGTALAAPKISTSIWNWLSFFILIDLGFAWLPSTALYQTVRYSVLLYSLKKTI